MRAIQLYNKVALATEFGWSEEQINNSTEEFINAASKISNLINFKNRK